MAKKRDAKPKKTQRKRIASSDQIYQLEIFLTETDPRIWRRFEVQSDINLAELHDIIQMVMGWHNCHMHQFMDLKEKRYAPRHGRMADEWNDEVSEECASVLRDVMPKKGSRLVYEYDFGDGWTHGLKVVAVGPPKPGVRYPRCLAGEKACPPEDCGGVYGYYDLLKILANPKHKEHKDYREWIGGNFDPDEFDLEGVNDSLASIR